ncbi:MAG: di-heme oxidoredictase family protein [Gammaproteobacteria bacterium]
MSTNKRIYASSLLLILLVCFCPSFINEVVASSKQHNRKLFSLPSKSLVADVKLDFMLGRSLFRRLWVTAPASTQAADGLGPLYNARSCMACHPSNARGRGPLSQKNSVGELLLRIDIPPQNELQYRQLAEMQINNIPEPHYGLQMQNFAIPGQLAEYQLEVE